MSCIQATSVGKPSVIVPNRAELQHIRGKTHGASLKLIYKPCGPQLRSRQHSKIVCLFGGKGKSEDVKSPWEAFGKAMGNFTKGQSIEDLLRQQMEKKEYYDGSGGKSPPRGGGGGGGGDGNGDGSGESGDEGFGGIIDETTQVILATLGIVFVYIYILTGEELILLVKDYFKYLFGGYPSFRLKNAMYIWGRFLQRFKQKKVYYDKYWLEKAIINTPTWYDSPEKYRQVLRAYMEEQEDDDDLRDNDDGDRGNDYSDRGNDYGDRDDDDYRDNDNDYRDNDDNEIGSDD